MKTAMKRALGGELTPDQDLYALRNLAAYMNGSPTPVAAELIELREACLRFAETGEASEWMPLQNFLNRYPVRFRVAINPRVNHGRPFFNYFSATAASRAAKSFEVTHSDRSAEVAKQLDDYAAEVRLPSMIVKMLKAMQEGKLDSLRQCEGCGEWIHARRKDARWCPKPKRCKERSWEKSEIGKKANADRQKRLYDARKDRAVAQVLAIRSTTRP